ncbi:RNA-binding transcriptional accessory protein [Lactobacillus sp. CC-MHH1034]|uniref:Tex family protein n=1 Tax=Agrilactobacillus fermenti TaxID=2586909 RepID=UPI001E51770D|nr:Tex family protein [Agrilactobacillus fermenti]MCD2255121.1 RNA-binding transcriptional accessory protein [Agrilactobacillus fermenti]
MDTQIQTLTTQKLPQYGQKQIQAVLTLLEDGNTVPFIARYRKERTGSLDEVQIREIEHTYSYLENLEKRRHEVLATIEAQGKLTPELKQQLTRADKLQTIEDLYLPYKKKRRTKATIAKEHGLEPLANYLLLQQVKDTAEMDRTAQQFVDPEKEVPDLETAYAGAHEIIAEFVSEAAKVRAWVRNFTAQNGDLTSTVKDKSLDEKGVYELYYDFSEPIKNLVSHRILAINRGEKEDILKVALTVDENRIQWHLDQLYITNSASPAAAKVKAAIWDGYNRFIAPAIAREIRADLKTQADAKAIDVFGENLKHLLLQPPMKGRIVLGFDPAYRTGCKLAIVDGTGKFLDKMVIYPHKPAPEAKRKAAFGQFKAFIEQYQVEMIAIGNGTASRESVEFVVDVLKSIERQVYYVIVNEAGASVYSASDNARAEFPDFHVEERSAVSIARRLQDPLAELLKIDPKAVGVGQYQHDVSQKALSAQLDVVVEDVVNNVGVNLNTASPELLVHISGLTKTTANNIVKFRNENGKFQSRKALNQVPRLGPKAYEQSVGFLRIIAGQEPLDNTDIHPESYPVAQAILEKLGFDETAIGTDALKQALKRVNTSTLAAEMQVGTETLTDIFASLAKPGRDLRDDIPAPLLRQDVLTIEDLKPNMALQGTVRNVVDFGAFVDIGVKHDGLVHISQLADRFIKDPNQVVSVGDIVNVWVLSVDLNRERVQLTMIDPNDKEQATAGA